MKRWIWFILCILLLIQLSCSRSIQQKANEGIATDSDTRLSAGLSKEESFSSTTTPASSPAPDLPDLTNISNRKIIQNGNMSLEVEDPDKTSEVIQQYAVSKKGYLARSEKKETQNIITIDLTIKIPVQEWTGFMSFLRKQGKVKNESIFTDEITNEYYDTTARLKNAENSLKQYTTLLMRAQKIEDIVLIQQRIDSVQLEIEQHKGRLKMWDQQVALSTIDIYIRQTPTTQATSKNPTWDFLTGSEMWKLIKNNAIIMFSGIIKFLEYFFVILVIYILPIGLIIWFLYWLVTKIISVSKKSEKKKK